MKDTKQTTEIIKKLNNVDNNLTNDSKEIKRLKEVIRVASGLKKEEQD